MRARDLLCLNWTSIYPGWVDLSLLAQSICCNCTIFNQQRRDHLTRFKQVRDALRIDNVKLRHQGGLVSHLDLLRDFEDQVDKVAFTA